MSLSKTCSFMAKMGKYRKKWSRGLFFGSSLKIELLDQFCFFLIDAIFCPFTLLQNGYLQNMNCFWVISEKREKVRKFRGRKVRFGTPTTYQTILKNIYIYIFPQLMYAEPLFGSSIYWVIWNIFLNIISCLKYFNFTPDSLARSLTMEKLKGE